MPTSSNRSSGPKNFDDISDRDIGRASDAKHFKTMVSGNRPKSTSECVTRKESSRRRSGMHSIHAYFSRELGFDVKVIAANERRTIQSLVGEAIDVILITRGYPARGER